MTGLHPPDELGELVERALDVLGMRYSHAMPGVLEVEVPGFLEADFGSSGRVRWVLDRRVWEASRLGTLVVPGSRVLDALESMLRDQGASVTALVGGDLVADESLLRDWLQATTLLNARSVQVTGVLDFQTMARFLFEVPLPEPLSRTELIPVFIDLGTQQVVGSGLAAELTARTHWYDLDEVTNLLEGPGPNVPAPVRLARAQKLARETLATRLSAYIAEEFEQHRDRIGQRRQAYEAEHTSHLKRLHRDIQRYQLDQALADAEESHRKRMHQLDRESSVALQATLQSMQILHVSKALPELMVETQQQLRGHVTLPLVAGRVRRDLCSACSDERLRYFVRVADGGASDLVCDHCGTACMQDDCGKILLLEGESACHVCAQPTYCQDHVRPCVQCERDACPKHGTLAACCGAWLCDVHAFRRSPDGRPLCPAHGRQCGVDGAWHHLDQSVQAYGREGTWVCDEHAVEVDLPEGVRVHPDDVRKESARGRSCYVDLVGKSSIDDRFYLKHELTDDGLSPGVFHPSQGIHLASDERLLHPHSVVTARNGKVYARDRVGVCAQDQALHPLTELRQDSANRGRKLCPDHGREVEAPEGWFVPTGEVVIEAAKGRRVHQSQVAASSVSDLQYLKSQLITDGITEAHFHPLEAASVRGDHRALHPDSIVETTSGQRVARDRAGQCEADKRWHLKQELQRTDSHPRRLLCGAHGATVQAPDGWFVPASEALIEAAGKRLVHRSVATQSPYDDRLYLSSECIQDPVTGQPFHRSLGERASDSGIVHHPSSLVSTVDAGRLPRSDTGTCTTCGRIFSRAALERDHVTREFLCETDRVTTRFPKGRFASPQHVRTSKQGAYDTRRYQICSITGAPVAIVKLVVCPDTQRAFLSGAGESYEGRQYHPDAMQDCPVSKMRFPISIARTVDCCGRAVHPEAVRVEQGKALCEEHGWCTHGGHADRAGLVDACGYCGAPVCRDHSFRRAYYPETRACRSHLPPSGRCATCNQNEVTLSEDADSCVGCGNLNVLSPSEERVYRRAVAPKLPGLRLVQTRMVSGTAWLKFFEVKGMFGATYHVLVDQHLKAWRFK